jgi:tetratricopeptide (TPR) repeat protein
MPALIPLLRALALTTLLLAPAAALDRSAFDQAKTGLEQAISRSDVAGLMTARARLRALAESEPASSELHYWVAVADWRLVPTLMNRKVGKNHKEQARRLCEEGIAAAERALALDAGSAEALALKASLEGLSLSFRGPAAMMTVGPRMEGDLKRALEMAADNPRVHLLAGINAYHKPAFVGGGAKSALPEFQKAIACFARDSAAAGNAATAAPDWGRADAYVWAGRAAMKLEDFQGARGYFTQALAVDPENVWVRESLMPQAEKALQSARGGEAR